MFNSQVVVALVNLIRSCANDQYFAYILSARRCKLVGLIGPPRSAKSCKILFEVCSQDIFLNLMKFVRQDKLIYSSRCKSGLGKG